MNSEREQLKENYKRYLDRLNSENKCTTQSSKTYCQEHCNMKEAVVLLVMAKYLDFVKEDEDEKNKKELKLQTRIAVLTGLLGFAGSLAVAYISLFAK